MKHLLYAGVGTASSAASALRPERTRGDAGVALRIVMYHKINDLTGNSLSVSPGLFRQQLEQLVREWDVISPEQLRRAIVEAEPLPERAVLLTFDDGYRDNKTSAYPHLRDLGLQALLFVCTRRVGTDQRFAHDMGLPVDNPLLDWDEVNAMSDVFTVGSHAETHRLLSQLPHDEASEEIRRSKDEIRARTGQDPWAFSYPGGDWTESLEEVVREAGYICSFGTVPKGTSRAELRRAAVLPRYNVEPFGMRTFGLMLDGHCDLVGLKDSKRGKMAKQALNRLLRTPG